MINNKYKKWLTDNKYTYTLRSDSNNNATILSTLKDQNNIDIIITSDSEQYYIDTAKNSIILKELYDADNNTIFEIYNKDNKLVCKLYLMNNVKFNSDYTGITGTVKTEWV
jgi:hypothetical protein